MIKTRKAHAGPEGRADDLVEDEPGGVDARPELRVRDLELRAHHEHVVLALRAALAVVPSPVKPVVLQAGPKRAPDSVLRPKSA